MQLTSRQKEITRIVRENGPITGEMIAERLHVTRSALRGDLAVPFHPARLGTTGPLTEISR